MREYTGIKSGFWRSDDMGFQSQFSVIDLLLLNILFYLPDENNGCFDENDRNLVFQAVQSRPLFQKMQLISATVISEDGAVCGAFLCEHIRSDPESVFRELIVVFRGTSQGEWLDNFLGGAGTEAEDGVSTKQQIRALQWYQTLPKAHCYVTVTGHSKGGNKAKYIAVLDDSVDRCVSFNGQGFSEEFVLWYCARIAFRQQIIENHNTEYDYVNWLLHDFGNCSFYKNQMSEKGFLAGHCANALLKISESGVCSMEYADQEPPEVIQWLDRIFNGALHMLPKRQKITFLERIGTRIQNAVDEAFLRKEIFKDISQIFQTIFR